MPSAVKPLTLRHPGEIGEIHFVWIDDRFEHVIQLANDKIKSRPGSATDAWPDSPPIQQLSIESIDGRDVALGVGCAGTSHWSLSVEPSDGGFRFDWACRSKESPDRLGSTYTHKSAPQFVPEKSSKLVVQDAEVETRIEPNQPLTGPGTYRWSYEVHRPHPLVKTFG